MANSKKSIQRPKVAHRKVQFKNVATNTPPAGVLQSGGRDYFREPAPAKVPLVQIPQPSITPERVTQSVRMRFNPLRGLTPEKVVNNLEQWRLGFFRNAGMMFDVMERRDYQLQIVAPKRKKSVARHGYDVTVAANIPDGMETLAEEQQKFLDGFWKNCSATTALDPDEEGGFALLARQMMDAVGKHYAVHEIVYQPQADSSLTAKFIFCPIWWFEGTRGKLRFLDSEFQVYGRDMNPGEWLVTIHDGIMEACSLLYLFKWNAIKAWMIFLDKFGQPGVQGLTDAQKGSKEWEDFKEAVSEFSEEYATVTNRSCEIKLIEAAKTGGSGSLFDVLLGEMNKAMTMIWRGGDLGTRSSTLGQGTGASLQQDETEILETDDAKIIEETLRKKVEKFALAWKFGPDVPVLAQITLRTNPEKATDNDLKIDEFLLSNGCALDKGETYERYGRNVPPADAKAEDIIEATTPQDEAARLAAEAKAAGVGDPASFANDATSISGTLHDMLLPLLKRLDAIAKVPDAGIQQHMIEKLLADFPQIADAIVADDSLAKKLSPQLEAALLAGLKGKSK